jgi:hypothetical protein
MISQLRWAINVILFGRNESDAADFRFPTSDFWLLFSAFRFLVSVSRSTSIDQL